MRRTMSGTGEGAMRRTRSYGMDRSGMDRSGMSRMSASA